MLACAACGARLVAVPARGSLFVTHGMFADCGPKDFILVVFESEIAVLWRVLGSRMVVWG